MALPKLNTPTYELEIPVQTKNKISSVLGKRRKDIIDGNGKERNAQIIQCSKRHC